MNIPFYRPSSRSLFHSLLLLLVLVLMVLTGLGVFRLYFGFEWLGDRPGGELFNLRIRGGNAFNLFSAEPFARSFWVTLGIGLLLALLLPRLKPIGAAILVLIAAAVVAISHFQGQTTLSALSDMPFEFSLLTILVLFVVYALLAWIGELSDQNRMSGLLSQYVPEELVEQYRQDPAALSFDSEQRDISVLFCDVVGYTSVAASLQPTELAGWLNEFFNFTSRIVVRHRGTIDKYMGDSIMAVWGAPRQTNTHSYDALCAALDIKAELAELNKRLAAKGQPEIRCGIGIATGPAMVGPLGSDYRRDYTVVGDIVNVAQRLESQTRRFGVDIIVSDRIAENLPSMLFRELDSLSAAGRQNRVTMFEVLGRADQASDELKELLALHQEALEASRKGNLTEASELFVQLRDQWGPSEIYEFYLNGISQVTGNRLV